MISVFCDFDGTITTRDSIVFLTEAFGGGPNYRWEALDRIKTGQWSVHEAIRHELLSVKIPWKKAVEVLKAEIQLDPFFEEFVAWCRGRSFPIRVVSSGMRPVVNLFVGHLDLEIHAHPVDVSTEGWRYEPDPASMKVAVLEKARQAGEHLVFVGDGTSDVCAIPYADELFAKKYLAAHCRAHGVPFIPFDTFADVQRELEEIVGRGPVNR